jgi:hypothetical protein
MTTISGLDGKFRCERKLQLEMKYKIMQRANEGLLFCHHRELNIAQPEELKLQSQSPRTRVPELGRS